ncbi:MAG TPA: DUF6088 family protein [Clostridia bacterium]|nr:DUF6088 family protein [Clostridia bacterium]HOR90412.1 DUF6088 family protein [Clostridia bacterium]HPL08581.1 DUF6088 family protein [Clostridia bacterium]
MGISYKESVVKKIESFEAGTVFIANDFLEIAGYERIRNILNRLVKDGTIHRILNGVYYQPKYSELIDEYVAPNVHQVALAIARKYNWTITPSENTALNILGLSTQVPAKWVYLSDGRYVTYSFGGIDIEFKRRSNAEISNMSTITSMVIQAIKAIGKDRISEEQIDILKKRLSGEEKKALLREGKTATAWIYEILRKIGEEDE